MITVHFPEGASMPNRKELRYLKTYIVYILKYKKQRAKTLRYIQDRLKEHYNIDVHTTTISKWLKILAMQKRVCFVRFGRSRGRNFYFVPEAINHGLPEIK